MLRYFFDEHVIEAIAEQLVARGVDVLTAQAAGLANRSIHDGDLLRYAAGADRVMVLQDRDFTRVAFEVSPHVGVILLQRPLSIGQYVEYLELMAYVMEPDEMRNQLIFCDW